MYLAGQNLISKERTVYQLPLPGLLHYFYPLQSEYQKNYSEMITSKVYGVYF
jgi:hypothetical protein